MKRGDTQHPGSSDSIYDDDESEFLVAIKVFREKNKKNFPTHVELLKILKDLGYRKPNYPDKTVWATENDRKSWQNLLHRIKRSYLRKLYEHCNGNLKKMSAIAAVPEKTLAGAIERYRAYIMRESSK